MLCNANNRMHCKYTFTVTDGRIDNLVVSNYEKQLIVIAHEILACFISKFHFIQSSSKALYPWNKSRIESNGGDLLYNHGCIIYLLPGCSIFWSLEQNSGCIFTRLVHWTLFSVPSHRNLWLSHTSNTKNIVSCTCLCLASEKLWLKHPNFPNHRANETCDSFICHVKIGQTNFIRETRTPEACYWAITS